MNIYEKYQKGIKCLKRGILVNGFAYQNGMTCRCLLGHLLITFACSSKPARRREAVCAAQVRVA